MNFPIPWSIYACRMQVRANIRSRDENYADLNYILEVIADPVAVFRKYRPDMGVKMIHKKWKSKDEKEEYLKLRNREIERLEIEEAPRLRVFLCIFSVFKLKAYTITTEDRNLWSQIHLKNVKRNSVALQVFFKRFYPESDGRMLDRCAATFEPEFVISYLSNQYKIFTSIKPLIKNGEIDHRFWACSFLRLLPTLTYETEDWFFDIIEACSKDPYNRAMLVYLLPDYENVLEERNVSNDTMKRRRQRIMCTENEHEKAIESENLVTEMRKKDDESYKELRCEGLKTDLDADPLSLRPYQEELVETAVQGKNTVVCAPTGAGKTELCIFIAMNHLEKKKKPDNMLKSVRANERLYICDFSLLIFDEVHHCTKNHPYNVIMNMVHEYNGLKPQVLGLTASMLHSGGINIDSAMDEIYELLANVGCSSLATVQRHLKSLEEHVPRPDDDTIKVERPNEDSVPYRDSVVRIMNQIQKSIKPVLKKLVEKADSGFKLSDVLCKSLAINDLMPSRYSYQYLNSSMKELRERYVVPCSMQYFGFYQEVLELEEKAIKEDTYPHPIVDELKVHPQKIICMDKQKRSKLHITALAVLCNEFNEEVFPVGIILCYRFYIQSLTGRARAKGSRSVLLVLNDTVLATEYDAIMAEKMMKKCIGRIQEGGPRYLLRQV
uniref:DEAD domain-containing protein n=1 Tax=Heterorhabditis bacteriophora TaxID=37862 RepID=A0A1I7WS96_HETBA